MPCMNLAQLGAHLRRHKVLWKLTHATEDEEMQPLHHINRLEDPLHTASLGQLFKLPKDQLKQWPGIAAYCMYLEQSFMPLLEAEYADLWTSIEQPRPASARDCWPWFEKIVITLRSLDDEESSIDEVWKCLITTPEVSEANGSVASPKPPATSPTRACSIALFSVLCWSTMTLGPQLTQAGSISPLTFKVSQQRGNQPGLKMDFVQRPILTIFRHFQRTMRTTQWRHPIGRRARTSWSVLHSRSLSYASLHSIAKIHLVWADSLTDHLDFDAANRVLSVFRFPSFCALSILSGGDVPPIMVGLLRALYEDADADLETENGSQLYQEVLMSYRLLFGQSYRARKLMKLELKKLRDQDNAYDQFLELLCCRRDDSKIDALPSCLWPVTCRNDRGSLQEESAYNSHGDFPMLGQRLAKLQDFSLRQQPSRLRDLWRDRRNPLQWYTFWAVLVFGGVSILIAVLQLLVGVAQIAVSFHSSPSCNCAIS